MTPHGELLDRARVALGITQREAARRAKISEGRWRQVVTGVQRQGGVSIPVNPKPSTLAAMARAVEANVAAVMAAAGFSDDDWTEPPTQQDREETALAVLEQTVAELRERVDRLENRGA